MFDDLIRHLATAIRAAVKKHKAQTNPAPVVRVTRLRRRDFNLRLRKNFGFANFPAERIEEDVWESRDQTDFEESVLKKLPEYESLMSVVGANLGSVERFASFVTVQSFCGINDLELNQCVADFGRELAGEPLPIKVTAFISGLSVSESPLVISDDIRLREPTPEDVTEFVNEQGFTFPLGVTSFDVIGEFVFDAAGTGEAQKQFLRIIEALRLFRVGGIAANRYEMSSNFSYMLGARHRLGAPDRHSPYSYEVSKADVPNVNEFIREVTSLLPDPFHMEEATTETAIAYTRYRDAIFQEGPTERAITAAITALEALFLEDRPPGGASHRLAQRVSVFLRVLGTDPDALRTCDWVKKGYSVRNTFIHGGFVRPAERGKADASAPILLEYARKCILAFFQLTTPKPSLLTQIDKTMIDPTSTQELEASLAQVKHK